jgi:DNA ligase (NAD+)
MGQKSADNIITAIEKSKNITLNRFIFALGIRHVGEHVANLIAERLKTPGNFYSASQQELEEIEGIGPIAAKSIADFLSQKENKTIIEKITDAGVKITGFQEKEHDFLKQLTFVLTGTLENMTRSEAKKKIEAAGGKVGSAVALNTDYLVCGEAPGSKLVRAKELGIKIINEKEFADLLQQGFEGSRSQGVERNEISAA